MAFIVEKKRTKNNKDSHVNKLTCKVKRNSTGETLTAPMFSLVVCTKRSMRLDAFGNIVTLSNRR
jgi:hypothetical protein